MPRAVDLTGSRIGSLVALGPSPARTAGGVTWRWRCDCGVERTGLPSVLRLQVARRGGTACRSCRPRIAYCHTPVAPRPSAHQIVDALTRLPYVDVTYPDGATARDELAALLQPYPAGHYWRRRLQAVRVGDVVPRAPRDREPGIAAAGARERVSLPGSVRAERRTA